MWIFDEHWKAAGQVVGMPSHAEQTSISALWNKTGDMLAVAVDCRIQGTDHIEIGIVNLTTRHFERLLSFKMSDGPSVVWAGNQLFTSSLIFDSRNRASWTAIVKIDPAKKQVSEMYREKMGSDSDIWIQTLLPSPNGKLIAFDRKTPWATEGAGIDVLDIKARTVTRLTSEPRTNYSHCLGRWKDDQILLFLRHNVPVSRWALYEVILRSNRKSKTR